jgi:hypothetical protein
MLVRILHHVRPGADVCLGVRDLLFYNPVEEGSNELKHYDVLRLAGLRLQLPGESTIERRLSLFG